MNLQTPMDQERSIAPMPVVALRENSIERPVNPVNTGLIIYIFIFWCLILERSKKRVLDLVYFFIFQSLLIFKSHIYLFSIFCSCTIVPLVSERGSAH